MNLKKLKLSNIPLIMILEISIQYLTASEIVSVQNKVLYSSQYGFRTKHSTEFATLEVMDIFINMERIDKKETLINIYLDVSKSFETLEHNILKQKLHHYGVRRTYLNHFW